jgi:hypothetical protein
MKRVIAVANILTAVPLSWLLAAEEAKTKSVDGKEHPASDFLYVGDPDDPATWTMPDFDEAHVRDALSRFDQDKVIPASKKKAMAKKLAAKATKLGIDCDNFKKEYVSAEAADLSLDQRQQLLNGALREQFGLDGSGYQRFYLFEAFDDYLIARCDGDGKLYRIPYAIDGDEVSLDSAQEVTTAYVPVAEACSFVAIEGEATAAESGIYPIRVLKAGWGNGSLNGQSVPHYYPPEFVKTVAEAANGSPFGRRHPDQKSADPTGALDPDRIAGWLEGGKFDDASGSAISAVKLFSAESDLRSKFDDARNNKKLDLFAVSMLAAIGYRPGVVEGKKCLVAESLGKLYSVDLCARAGAGGEFLTAAGFAGSDIATAQQAAVNPQSPAIAPLRRSGNRGGAASATEGASMKNAILRLLEALRQKNPARCAELSLKFATTTEAEYPAFLDTVTTAVAEPPAPAAGSAATVTTAEAQTILNEAHRLQSRNRIEAKLTESKLSEPAKKLVREHLESALVAEANIADAAIDGEITRVREAFAAFSNVGRVRPANGVVLDSADKMTLAMEAALGVKAAMDKGVPAFRGIREAYVAITGDHDLRALAGGGFGVRATVAEAVLTGDFPNILLNSMTKRLLQDWAELAVDGLKMLYTSAPISDYKVQDRVREGYFGELPIVNEGGTYAEVSYPTDELVTYSIQKRGGMLTISEETIRNDDLGAISRFPGRLARAGRFTLKRFITNFYLTNPNYTADSVAWFAAGHNNLQTNALAVGALVTAQTSLRLQQEKNSGEPLGFSLDWLMVPAALEATAIGINQTNTAGSNQFFHKFGDNNERIIVNELLDGTDNQSWYYGTQQNNAPFMEIGFLDGIENPQIFLANQPTIGTQFTQDELQYKVKFPFSGAITDFRGVGKSLV